MAPSSHRGPPDDRPPGTSPPQCARSGRRGSWWWTRPGTSDLSRARGRYPPYGILDPGGKHGLPGGRDVPPEGGARGDRCRPCGVEGVPRAGWSPCGDPQSSCRRSDREAGAGRGGPGGSSTGATAPGYNSGSGHRADRAAGPDRLRAGHAPPGRTGHAHGVSCCPWGRVHSGSISRRSAAQVIAPPWRSTRGSRPPRDATGARCWQRFSRNTDPSLGDRGTGLHRPAFSFCGGWRRRLSSGKRHQRHGPGSRRHPPGRLASSDTPRPSGG